MDLPKKSKVAPLPQRRKSLIEDYYAWRDNEFKAALADAAQKEALHKTPPPSPVYERRVAKIDGRTYEKERKKQLLEEVGDHELDLFKPHKKNKKFAMYPVVPSTPDETPCMSPNLSSASMASSHHHHHSFPHLPDIDESEHEDEDTPTKPIIFTFSSNGSLKGKNDEKSELEKLMERKLLPNDPNKPHVVDVGALQKALAVGGGGIAGKRAKRDDMDLEMRSPEKHLKYTKWEIVQEFVPWVMIVTSIIQIALFIVDRDEFFQLLVFAPSHSVELWRYVTYVFLHQDFTHVAMNVFIQILLAVPLEFEQNHGRIAVVYFGGSVLGACGVKLFGPQILTIGASAGVYSLLLSHIPHIYLNRRMIRYRNVRLGVVIFLCLSDVVLTLWHFSKTGNSSPTIGIWAHVFGALAGVLLGITVYKFIDEEDAMPEHWPRYYKKMRVTAIAVICLILISAIISGIVS